MRRRWGKAGGLVDRVLGAGSKYLELESGEIRRRIPKIRGKAARRREKLARRIARELEELRRARAEVRRTREAMRAAELGDPDGRRELQERLRPPADRRI